MEPDNCQIQSLPRISEGRVPLPSLSIRQQFKLFLKRHLDSRTKQRVKRFFNQIVLFPRKFILRSNQSVPLPEIVPSSERLEAGDLVQVLSRSEIEKTLSFWGDFKGCAFMAEMWPYCGTTQRILKPVRRFVDERDYQVKKCRGLVILEGVMCQGTTAFGQCDRSCFYFWREEWLLKIDRDSLKQSATTTG